MGEQYLAALQAMAFFENDMAKLIHDALDYIPTDSKLYTLITDVIHWCDEFRDWMYIRSLILKKYGHPDCTNLYQNMGIIVMALLKGEQDIIKTTMLAVNCGYDTDCTAATVGAILGILDGGESVMKTFRVEDVQYKLGVDVVRPTQNARDLAADVTRMGVYFSTKINQELKVSGFDGKLPVFDHCLP